MIKTNDIAPVRPQTKCKVCGSSASLYGVTDFNKNCEESHGRFLPLSGVPVYYHRCDVCGLVFTESFDHWAKSDYLEHIYNDDYEGVDPDYVAARPIEYAAIVREFVAGNRDVRHLDYGGGNGMLAKLMVESGIRSTSWDPMDAAAAYPSHGGFQLVTAFEVFEHTPNPHETLSEVVALCDESVPAILLSTYTIDGLAPRDVGFWYIAPRNGHVTIYTEAGLKALFSTQGLQVHHFGNGWHIAYRTLPAWITLDFFKRFYARERVKRRLRRLASLFTGRRRPRMAAPPS